MNVTAWRDTAYSEPGLFRAAVLALLVHLIFFAFMVFGLSWRNDPAETMVVELWSDLPQPIKPAPVVKETPPRPEPVRQPPPPVKAKSEPVKETTPPKPAPIRVETPPPPKKPAIEIKEKVVKPQPVKEAVKPPEPVKETPPPKPEPVKEKTAKPEVVKETKKAEIEKEKPVKEQLPAEDTKRQQQQREQEAAAQRAAADRSRNMDEIAKYKAMIQTKIRSRIVLPPDLPGNPVVEFRVTLLPGGEVLNVVLRKSSGYSAFDEAVERAVFLSTPLPIPPDPALFREFRDFNLTVYYREML